MLRPVSGGVRVGRPWRPCVVFVLVIVGMLRQGRGRERSLCPRVVPAGFPVLRGVVGAVVGVACGEGSGDVFGADDLDPTRLCRGDAVDGEYGA